MNRLSATDASFLYMETPETPMNVGSLTIFAPAANPGDVFACFRDHTAARLNLLPSYRRRLEMTPLGIDHPAWVDDDDLDLDYHIRHAALPEPGTMKQLRELVAQLHAIPLDRSRPLWQYYLIEGLEDGGFAVYVKTHHSAMDGAAGMAILDVVFDFSPDLAPAYRPRMAIPSGAPPPDFLELTSTAFADFLRQGFRQVRSLPSLTAALAKATPHLVRDARYLLEYARKTPRTRFNVAISSHRSYGTSSLSLPDVKAVGKARNATINDVVLALCAGALRRYLIEHKSLPDAPLIAGVPASLRAPGDARLNVQAVFTLSRLATNVPDSLARLAATRVATQEAKDLFADVKDLLTTDVSVFGAPLVMTALFQLMASTRAANVLPPLMNVVISNVPGPRNPMYCAGAPARHYFALSIPFHGCALNITVQSYLDQLDFGLTACRATVPDVQLIADYLVEEFEAMKRAHEAITGPDAIETIEISAPPAAASPKRLKRKHRMAAKRAVAANPVAASAQPMTAVRPTAASAGPRIAAENPPTPVRPAMAAAKPGPARTQNDG
jgi:diacylglycerol O-acyltransferase / wax synthase